MQGVTILNTIPVYETHWVTGLIIGALVGLGIGIGILLFMYFKEPTIWEELLFVYIGSVIEIALFSSLFGGMIGDCFHKELVETRYEIRLDDTIDLGEFMDKYEVIEQRENSWIVKERTE